MYDILVYITEEDIEQEIRLFLEDAEFNIHMAENSEDVIEVCQEELIDLILVWPCEIDKTAALISLLSTKHFDYLPIVPIVDSEIPVEDIWSLRIADYIQLPKSKVVFAKILKNILYDVGYERKRANADDWAGSLEEYNVIDLIQMIEISEQDVELSVRYDDFSGKIFFKKGKLIDASFRDQSGMAALDKLAFWPKGHFQIQAASLEGISENITDDNQEILISQVKKVFNLEALLSELPGFTDEIMHNPLVSIQKLTPLQREIADICQKPLTVLAVLLKIAAANKDILTELKMMMQTGNIGRRNDVEFLVQLEEEKSGLGKLIDSMSSIFKKKSEIDFTYSSYEISEEAESQATIEIPPVSFTPEENERIIEKLETFFK